MTVYSINHDDTHKGMTINNLPLADTLELLKEVTNPAEWYVTAWDWETGDIEYQINAEEFLASNGDPNPMKTAQHPDCPACQARGKIPHPRLPFREKLCDRCGGRGRIVPQPKKRKTLK